MLRASQRIHAEALPILYRIRNFEFCEDCFGADSLDTEYQCYSITFLTLVFHNTPSPIFRSSQLALESIGMTKNHIDTVARSQISVI